MMLEELLVCVCFCRTHSRSSSKVSGNSPYYNIYTGNTTEQAAKRALATRSHRSKSPSVATTGGPIGCWGSHLEKIKVNKAQQAETTVKQVTTWSKASNKKGNLEKWSPVKEND